MWFFIAIIFGLFYIAFVNASDSKPIVVMVIDSGIDASHFLLKPFLDNDDIKKYNYDYMYDQDHGTHVTGIIALSNCPTLKILSCRYVEKEEGDTNKLFNCYRRAIAKHVDIINMSGGGEDFLKEEEDLLKQASNLGIKISVAAGNEGKNLGTPCIGYYPACLDLENLFAVGALNKPEDGGKRYSSSNYGKDNMKWEVGVDVVSTIPGDNLGKMTGTSMATAVYSRRLVMEMCK